MKAIINQSVDFRFDQIGDESLCCGWKVLEFHLLKYKFYFITVLVSLIFFHMKDFFCKNGCNIFRICIDSNTN